MLVPLRAVRRLLAQRLYADKHGRWRTAGSDIAVTASKSTQLEAVASPAASEPEVVEYPERQWIAQSVGHGDAVRLATAALEHHFRHLSKVLVAMELAVYHEQGNSLAWLRPDVQVVFGVGRGDRRVFKVWEEGKAPDFVLEVASPSTAGKDARHKARQYARIGVPEYWRLDPEGSMMGVPLEGYRARSGRYERVESVTGAGGVEYLRSGVLGLDLRSERRERATVLVLRDPRTGQEFDGAFDDALEASERHRRLAEDRASVAENQLTATRDELSATRDELTAVRDALSAKDTELSASQERVRELEMRLRDATGQTLPSGRDS